MDQIIKKLTIKCSLGEIFGEIKRIEGGLLNKMFKITTKSGNYALKLINPEVISGVGVEVGSSAFVSSVLFSVFVSASGWASVNVNSVFPSANSTVMVCVPSLNASRGSGRILMIVLPFSAV